MILTGYIFRIEQDLTPDQIIAPAYANSGDPALLAAHCLAAVDPALAELVREGDILVLAGQLHDGAGSEIAVLALQALGFAAIICNAAASDLRELAGVYGLPVLICAEATALLAPGNIARLDLEHGRIEERETGQAWRVAPCDATLIAAVRRAQLLFRMRRVVEDEGFAE